MSFSQAAAHSLPDLLQVLAEPRLSLAATLPLQHPSLAVTLIHLTLLCFPQTSYDLLTYSVMRLSCLLFIVSLPSRMLAPGGQSFLSVLFFEGSLASGT